MEDLAVFTALNHSGSFGKNFVKLKKKKICYLTGYGSVRMVQNCDLVPRFKTSRQIAYMYCYFKLSIPLVHTSSFDSISKLSFLQNKKSAGNFTSWIRSQALFGSFWERSCDIQVISFR